MSSWRLSAETVLGWIHSGKLAASRPGHRYLVDQNDLKRFLAQQKSDETGALRSRVDELTRLLMAQNGDKPKRAMTEKQKVQGSINLAKGRAARKAKRA